MGAFLFMGKRYTAEQIAILQRNPNVKKVRENRLSLTFEFRCRLYDVWIKHPYVSTVREYLKSNGIDCALVGQEFINL